MAPCLSVVYHSYSFLFVIVGLFVHLLSARHEAECWGYRKEQDGGSQCSPAVAAMRTELMNQTAVQ